MQEAIDELMSSGFDRADLSLLATERASEQKLGHRSTKIKKLEDDPTIPRAAYVSTESVGDAEGGLIGGLMYVGATAAAGAIVATGGTLAAAIVGAALAGGAGGLIGSMLAAWVGDQHARHLQEHLDRGGLLLWARTWDADGESAPSEFLPNTRAGTSTFTRCQPRRSWLKPERRSEGAPRRVFYRVGSCGGANLRTIPAPPST
jgi:hypothetical protein